MYCAENERLLFIVKLPPPTIALLLFRAKKLDREILSLSLFSSDSSSKNHQSAMPEVYYKIVKHENRVATTVCAGGEGESSSVECNGNKEQQQ